MAEVNATTLKLPAFWSNNPALWFRQAEAQFHLRGITTEETRYYHVVAALDQVTAERVYAILERVPDASRMYTDLKNELVRNFSLARRERAAKLVDVRGLGDRLPSQLLADMQRLMQQERPTLLFEYFFLANLPEDMRVLITDDMFQDLTELGKFADAIWLAKKSQPVLVAEVQRVVLDKSAVIEPSQKEHGVKCNVCAFGPVKEYRKKIPVKAPGKAPEKKESLCFYHRRFGVKARFCVEPCEWVENGQASRQ